MTSWWQKTLDTATGFSNLLGGAYTNITRRSLPQKQGSLHFQALHAPVDVITDSYGVPHIYAQNEDDLYFTQGFVHAQDRLWQLEFNRRLASGRLSEIFGPITLETDRFCRRLGMHRAAADEATRLSEQIKRVLDAYAQGINAFIKSHSSKLPVEFVLLRLQPAPWQPADTILWSKMMGWNLSGNWETELIRARLVALLGVERAARLEAGYDPQHPLIVPPGVEYQGINLGMLEQYAQIKQLSGFGLMGGASNNWAVDGTMSQTGSPILCNDPHLGQAAPSIWYECHLVAGDLDVIGASFPGAPGVIIGHNRHIAWGLTNAISDTQDLYIEKFNPDNPHQYEFEGQWQEAQIIREEIKVRGSQDPVVEEVRVTRHGPIITHMPDLSANQSDAQPAELPLALRWVGLEQSQVLSAAFKLNHATNWDEFLDAMRDWDVPPQNFVYADIEGNIGYIMAGAIPVRASGQALLPSPGWTGEYEWTGLIPFEELPQTFNPEQHFIVTANNRVVDDSYPHYITNEWLNGYRAQRIRDLLTAKGKLSLEDMASIQSDQYSLPAVAFSQHILNLPANTPLKRAIMDVLKTWDFVLAPESIGAAIYITFLRKLEHIFLGAQFGNDEELLRGYLGAGSTILATLNGYASRLKPLLLRLLQEQDDSWFANSAIPNGPSSWDTALVRALDATIEELSDTFGSNILRWQYGALHKMTYRHPLGSVKPLDALFNRGPYPVGGDADTVNMGATSPANPQEVIVVPSFRQIVDLGNLSQSLSVHSPGQSGQPASGHYDDFIPLWLAVKHHPMLFDHAMIEAQTEATLHLLPRRS